MTIEKLTAKIRPCERKKMQFILIGQLDNISYCVAQLVERRSLTGELSLSCALPVADG